MVGNEDTDNSTLDFGSIDRRSLANSKDDKIPFDLSLVGRDSKTDFSFDILIRRDLADLFLRFEPFDSSTSEELEEEENDDDDDESSIG